jgi:hypothetical protein
MYYNYAMTSIEKLEQRIEAIEQRNKKVELEKSWETSLFRKLTVVFLTYTVMVLLMHSINVSQPFVNALIPTIGFVLSTLSLPFLKQLWLNNRKPLR